MHKRTIITFLSFLILTTQTTAQNWDIGLAKNSNPAHMGSGYWKFTSAFTYIFSAAMPVGLLATGLATSDPKIKIKSLEVFAAIACGFTVFRPMKPGFERQRSRKKYPDEIFPYEDLHGQSFPSGHTLSAFAAATSLSIQCKKWYVTLLAYLWAWSVCWSKIYLGFHYPSNVLVGAAAGTGSTHAVHWANKQLFGNRNCRHNKALSRCLSKK